MAHLSVSETALDEFISLRRLNRASAIVIDSDKTSPHKRLNATKRRIVDEFDADAPAPGFAWITKGYTIENYLSDKKLAAAVEKIHPRVKLGTNSQWDNPLAQQDSGPAFDKVGIAAAVATSMSECDLDVLDLRQRIDALCAFIRSANGHSVAPDEA